MPEFRITSLGDGQLQVGVDCFVCKQPKTVQVPAMGFYRWARREALVQDALPELAPAERELLISQTCGGCFAELTSPPDLEHDDDVA